MLRETVRSARRAVVPAALTALTAVTAAACSANGQGGSITVTTGAGDESVEIVVDAHDVYFDPAEIVAPAGTLEIELVEHGSQPHTLVFDDVDGYKLSVTRRNKDDSGSLDIEPGTYTYYCDIPGHRGQGMHGTLTLT